MNSAIKQRAFTTLAATALIGGAAVCSAPAASAATGDLTAIVDGGDVVQADANVNLNNTSSIIDTAANANVKLGNNSLTAPVTNIVDSVSADAAVNLANPSQITQTNPLTTAVANVNIGTPYVAPAPAPAVAPLAAPAAEVKVALNAATNTTDSILSNFTGENQGGLTGTLVDGAANITIGHLTPGKQYDFVLYSDSSNSTKPTLLGTATADANGLVTLALPAGLVNSGDGSQPGLLNLNGDTSGSATGVSATDSLLRIAVLPGGVGVDGLANGGQGTLDGMVGWVDPSAGISGNGSNGSAAVSGPANDGSNLLGTLQNNGNVIPASNTIANVPGSINAEAAEAVKARGAADNLAETAAKNMGVLLPVGGLLLAAGSALFFYRRKLGLGS